MANKLKTGIIALGLGALLGLGTPAFAADAKKDYKTVQTQEDQQEQGQEQQQPEFFIAPPVIKHAVQYNSQILQNDQNLISICIEYLSGRDIAGKMEPAGYDIFVINGKKTGTKVELANIVSKSGDQAMIHDPKTIDYLTKIAAQNILTEEAKPGENKNTDQFIEQFYDAINTLAREI
ncbi:hypothetical protein FJZ53_01055 [Candidatus Woesearchaeota archaeon]|nr:hypothetical protein [Candidatus Woesearchaeota archaeon]